MKVKIMAIAAGVLAALMGAWMLVGYVPVRNIETPKYQLIEKRRGYEIRQYPAQIVAEVTVTGQYRDAINSGFRKVAGYIFGDNTAKASIAMTAPVLHEKQESSQKIAMTAPVLHAKQSESGVYTLAFVMPSAYILDTLPKPKNEEVHLKQVPPKKYAILAFRGYTPESKLAKKTQQLLDSLSQDSVRLAASPFVAEYDPPWTPPFMRKNEILVEIN
jgi:hypothetical protein